MKDRIPRLGVNIDHIATLRQLRGTPYPQLLEAARAVEAGGGEQITVHLREDRRHIQDEDVRLLRKNLKIPLNLEMAVSEEIIRFACRVRPDWACLVPEKRREVTTEGGLDVARGRKKIALAAARLKKAGIRVSLFVEPDPKSVELSRELGADAVELHTGRYAIATQGTLRKKPSASAAQRELKRIERAARRGQAIGLHVHAGHGLDDRNVRALTELLDDRRLSLIEEYNIGHFIVCRAAMVGLERAVREMAAAVQAP